MPQPSVTIATSLLVRSSCFSCRSIALQQRKLHSLRICCLRDTEEKYFNFYCDTRQLHKHPKMLRTSICSSVLLASTRRHLNYLKPKVLSSYSSSSKQQLTYATTHQRLLHKDSSKHKQLLSPTKNSSDDTESQTDGALPQVATPNPEELFSGYSYELNSFKGLESDFPCLSHAKDSGPEPSYEKVTGGYHLFQTDKPFHLSMNGGVLPQLDMAYETWGELNKDASNAVIVMGGLSASSHARSHPKNSAPGWWEKFVGPGCAVDTDKFFVICPNNLGSCYGSSGPSSTNILNGKPYATTFPIIGVDDMANAIFTLLEHLGIKKLHAAVGSSLGGMLSLQSAISFPEQVGRVISISSCAKSHPSSIALRYLQRKCIMSDPNWNKGHYYQSAYPKVGMKLAREIATMTYRSGPEWDKRFGRNRINQDPPSLCPTFLIESYLDHQGESFSVKYDPNSLLYISKAMDMYDISEGYSSLTESLKRVQCPIMVVGVQTDILFPIWQQRELAEALHDAGHEETTFYELNSIYGHDTFLLDLNGVGAAVKGFLETKQKETGWLTKHKLQSPSK